MRDKRITVRLTQGQYDEVEKKRGDIPKSEYLYLLLLEYLQRDLEIDKQLRKIREESLKRDEYCMKLHLELGRIGANANQIARALNKGRLPAKDREKVLNLASETMELIWKLKTKLRELQDGNPQED